MDFFWEDDFSGKYQVWTCIGPSTQPVRRENASHAFRVPFPRFVRRPRLPHPAAALGVQGAVTGGLRAEAQDQ